MYSLIDLDGKESKKKTKGVNRIVVRDLRHKKYVNILFDKGVMRRKMKRIQSKLHRMGTYDVYKVSLSCFEDKKYILDDDINGLAYFLKDVRSQWEM